MRNKKLAKKVFCAALAAALAVGCTVPAAADDKKVTVTLGIWPEDTLGDEIKMYEGFVEKMKEIDPDVEFVPAYYKYSTETLLFRKTV